MTILVKCIGGNFTSKNDEHQRTIDIKGTFHKFAYISFITNQFCKIGKVATDS